MRHTDSSPPSAAWLYRSLALVILLQGLTLVRYSGPPAQPADAPPDVFSAGRAMEVLDRLVGNGVPHPVGSAEHAEMLDRVLTEFVRLGYTPSVQETFVCGARSNCADVQNIVARLPGTGAGDAILLMAHYDSNPPGPGAADDGQGVAALIEIAGILRAAPQAHNDVIFLITDAEELGLLGAYGFVREHPWMADVRVAMNLEARGSRGPSIMFETGPNNARLIALLAEYSPRPMATSLYAAIYDRMPNDTDFSVTKAQGVPGLNFAFVGGLPHYHSPLDDPAHVDPRSVQHHGANVLAVVRALRDEPLGISSGDAVYFDVFGYGIISWARGYTLPLAVGGALLPLMLYGLLRGRGEVTGRQVVGAAVLWVCMLGVAGIAGVLITRTIAGTRGVGVPWAAYPLPTWLVLFTASFALPGLFAARVGRLTGAWATLLGTLLCLGGLGFVLALFLPGGSFYAIVPVWVVSIVALYAAAVGRTPVAPAVTGVLVLGALCFPLARGMQDAMGLGVHLLQTVPYALTATMLAPIFVLAESAERRRVGVCALAVATAGFVAALVMPHHTPLWPARMNVQFHQAAGAGTARWLIRPDRVPLPESFRDAADFSRERIQPFPFGASRRRAHVAPAPALDVPGPELTVLEDVRTDGGGRRLHLRLTSPRGAPTVTLFVAPETPVVSCLLDGHELEPMSPRAIEWMNGWRYYAHFTAGADGVDIVLTVDSPAPVDVILRDDVPGLPPDSDAILAARPAWAGPQHRGDLWTMTRRMQL